jgi:hypothetical protein
MNNFDSLNYSTEQLGLYHVEVFDKDGNKIDEAWVEDYTRRSAYFEVMGQLKPHSTFDSTRIKNI